MANYSTKNSFKVHHQPPYLLSLFFLSGFAGLCYQVLWIRQLSVIFGKTNAAITVVVSVFMLGLGLGSLYWGKRKIAPQKLSGMFAFLQVGIAGGSLLLLSAFPYLSGIYQGLAQHLGLSPTVILIFIFLLCAVLMFIPTFLMGGTFPIIAQLFIRREAVMGRGLGLLYGANTFGGILGTALTGYFLIGMMGQHETQLIAVAINFFLGLCFLRMRGLEPAGQKPAEQTAAPKNPDANPGLQRFLILAAFATGFAGLAYEILWTRALVTFTSNSIYSFSSILAVFLTGIGIGSYIYSKRLSCYGSPLALLVLLQLAIFGIVTITAVFLNDVPGLIGPFRGLLRFPVLRIIFPGLFISTVVMFLPTVLMGIVFPLICKMYTDSLNHLRVSIGKVYFYNTLGSVLGPIAAGFVLIPLVGVVKGLFVIALANLLLSIRGSSFFEKRTSRNRLLTAAIVIFAAAVLLPVIMGKSSRILPPSIFRNPHEQHVLKHYQETVDGTVVVVEDKKTGVRGCYVNNNAVCGVTYDALKVVHYMGHLPMIINPGAKNALVIGFGIGVTTSAVSQHPLDYIDCVEICPGVKDAAPLFEEFNRGVWKNSRVNFIAGDGRSYLLSAQKTYDIISCDPVHPGLGSGSLYSKEYFELCKAKMNPGGVISQYLPLHKLSLYDLKTLLNTFYSVFPHSMIWLAQNHGVLIGSNREISLSFKDIISGLNRFDDPFFKDPYLLASTLLFDSKGIKAFLANHPAIHSDNHPILEYFSPQSMQARHHAANIAELVHRRQPAVQLLQGVPDPVLLDRYIEGQSYYIQGIVQHNQGEVQKAFRLFQQALTINPQNREIRMFYQYVKKRL